MTRIVSEQEAKAQLTVRLLGPPQVELRGEPIDVDTRKAIALLAYLTITQRPQRRSTLATLFWPDSDHTRGRTALRRTLAALNKAIGKEWIEANRSSLEMNWELETEGRLWIDVSQFDQLISHYKSSNDVDSLQQAAELYRGEFLQGFSLNDSVEFDDWQFLQSEKYHQGLIDLFEKLVQRFEQEGAYEEGLHYVRRWLALDPASEAAHRYTMRLFVASGQRTQALRQYQECLRLLDEELGVAPQRETTELYERIASGDMPSAPARATIAPTPAAIRYSAPRPLTPLIGRDEELAHIDEMLGGDQCRLLTLIGSGGMGKTRLALEAAALFQDKFNQGACFVDLASVESGDYLIPAIARALDFSFSSSASTHSQLVDYLRAKELLLILDNFEELTDSSNIVTDILSNAPQVKILVTSQEQLNLREEWLLPLTGLKYPEKSNGDISAYEGVQLFLERACQLNPRFKLSERNRDDVARICRLVGGIPLGIELAATWVRMLTPSEIAARIDDTLDFLATTLRNVPERHRSLRAVFERAWQMLSSEEQDVFRGLYIFRGGFRAPAAAAVVDASLAQLLALVSRSLLFRTSDGRYQILPALVQYAREKFEAGDSATIAARHAQYYADFVASRAAAMVGAGQTATLDAVDREIENVRLAWRTAVEIGDTSLVERMMQPLFQFYERKGNYDEGFEAFNQALASYFGDPILVCTLLANSGAMAVRRGGFAEGGRRLGESLVCAEDDDNLVAFISYYLGMVSEATGDYEGAYTHQMHGLELFKRLRHQGGVAKALNALGNVARMQRDFEQAKKYFEESLALYRRLQDQRGIALCYNNLGHIQEISGNWRAAQSLYQQSLGIKRKIDDRRGLGYTLNNLGHLVSRNQAYDEAHAYLNESLDILRELGDRPGMAYVSTNFGNIALARGCFEDAQAHYEEAHAYFEELGHRRGIAFSLEDLGQVAEHLNSYDSARNHYLNALEIAEAINFRSVLHAALLGIARCALKKGHPEQALAIATTVRDLDPQSEAEQVWQQASEQVPSAAQQQIVAEPIDARDWLRILRHPLQ